MPDISMCRDKTCPSRTVCYRFTAVPNPLRQSYASFDRKGMRTCGDYWPCETSMKLEMFSAAVMSGMCNVRKGLPKLAAVRYVCAAHPKEFQEIVVRFWQTWAAHRQMDMAWNGYTCKRIVDAMEPGGAAYPHGAVFGEPPWDKHRNEDDQCDRDIFLALVYLFKTFTAGEWLATLSEID